MKTFSLLALALATTGCGTKDKDDAPVARGNQPTAPGTTPSSPPLAGTASTSSPAVTPPGTPPPPSTGPVPANPGANTPHTTDHPTKTTTAVFEGAACTAGLLPVTDVPISIDGAALRFTRSRGGGCPQRAVYTAFYVKGNPVSIRVCIDPGADACEMMIQDERVVIDLTPALAASGATAAILTP